MKKSSVSAIVFALLVILCAQVVFAIRGESLTWDEGDHIFAGYEMWKTGDYGLNPEHPPMVKLLAALPLLPLDLKAPPLQGRFFKDESYLDGRELLFHNGRYPAELLTFRMRLPELVFTVAAALLVFFAGWEMFSLAAGLIGLTLFCFEPNLLAHGAYVTTDMAAAATIFATIYAFWRWVRSPSLMRLLVVGLAAGLALAAKHSTVLLLPMLLLVSAGELLRRWLAGDRRSHGFVPGRELLRFAGAVVAIVLVGVGILWAFYGFRYAARPAPLALKPSLVDYVGTLAGVESQGILLAARWHVLPESWLYGLADVREMANGMPSYFFGKVYAHGVWFYFPVLFTIKSTLGMLGLLLLTLFAFARGWLRGKGQELWFLVAPPALYFAVAMVSQLNIGARHILPVWVFCCVVCGAGAAALLRRGRAWAVAVFVLLAMHVASSLLAAPNYIAYANEAWGGPRATYKYLSDSNTDWAQQLVATRQYLQQHNIHECWIAYFAAPFILPADYGIPCKRLPTPDSGFEREELPVPPVIQGPVLVSAGDLNSFELGSDALNPMQPFRTVEPAARIQDGIFVYDGTFAVPLASALSHAEASGRLLKAKDTAGALAEAKVAESLAPGEIEPELALGDALAKAGDRTGALAAYASARLKIETMLPDAREDWEKRVAGKVASLGQ